MKFRFRKMSNLKNYQKISKLGVAVAKVINLGQGLTIPRKFSILLSQNQSTLSRVST